MALSPSSGNSLFQPHRALAAVDEGPQRLNQTRKRRFSQSSLSNPSTPDAPTQSESPASVNDALVNYNARLYKLYADWQASLPATQFDAQTREERQRIELARERVGVGSSPLILAGCRVREQWIEQGIWDDRWYKANVEKHGDKVRNAPLFEARWMHEMPLEDDTETNDYSPIGFQFSVGRKRQKSPEEAQQSAERRAESLRRRELSRPIHQFNYQVSRERDRLLEEASHETENRDPVKECPPDIDTQAYTTVKDKWVSAGLWVEDWGTMPGMSWFHESDLDELIHQLGPKPSPRPAAPAAWKASPAARLRIFGQSRPRPSLEIHE